MICENVLKDDFYYLMFFILDKILWRSLFWFEKSLLQLSYIYMLPMEFLFFCFYLIESRVVQYSTLIQVVKAKIQVVQVARLVYES